MVSQNQGTAGRNITTKYGKKGGFKTPEEAEKSYWEYEKADSKSNRRDLQGIRPKNEKDRGDAWRFPGILV